MVRSLVARASLVVGLALGSMLMSSKSAQADAAIAQRALGGSLRLVTYNVAGLPEGISRSRPSINMPLIGKLLNDYDLALVQEDFAYAQKLRSTIALPFATPPFLLGNNSHFGDGLSQFARFPFSKYMRRAWNNCHGILDFGSDCLTPKGFTLARHALGEGAYVDVYNLHMDSGGSAGDSAARAGQIEQLVRAIARHSGNEALIVAGDTNLDGSEQELLDNFQRQTGLADVCQLLGCKQPWRIDRVFIRSSDSVRLTARSWSIDSRFVDEQQRPLSDHAAVAVTLDWARVSADKNGRAVALSAKAEPRARDAARSRVRSPGVRRQ